MFIFMFPSRFIGKMWSSLKASAAVLNKHDCALCIVCFVRVSWCSPRFQELTEGCEYHFQLISCSASCLCGRVKNHTVCSQWIRDYTFFLPLSLSFTLSLFFFFPKAYLLNYFGLVVWKKCRCDMAWQNCQGNNDYRAVMKQWALFEHHWSELGNWHFIISAHLMCTLTLIRLLCMHYICVSVLMSLIILGMDQYILLFL